jgi:hypothetical protein
MCSSSNNPFTKRSVKSTILPVPYFVFALDAKTAFVQQNLRFIKISLTAKKKKSLHDSNFKIGKDEDESVPDLFLVTAFLSEL